MMDGSVSSKLQFAGFWQDLTQTFSAIPGTLLELAFADQGTSKFNRAVYYESLTAAELEEFSQKQANVSFLANCSRSSLEVPLLTLTKRSGNDRCILQKNVISLDIDFKDQIPEWSTFRTEEKTLKARELFEKLKTKIEEVGLPVWIVSFSGNGFHLHFKMSNPLSIENPRQYKEFYEHLSTALTLLFEGQVKFDEKCCNAARLMRLPLSTNWKDVQNPIPGQIFFYKSNADASAFFTNFNSGPSKESSNRTHTSKYGAIVSKLTLESVLTRFQYAKFSSLEQRGIHLVCSSPFGEDKTPSFYFQLEKKLFFDFSSNRGGDFFSLIAQLANLDCKTDFSKILKIARKIAGIAESTPMNRYSLREDGVWFSNPVEDDTEGSIWICSWLEILAYTRNSGNDSWGRLLSFKDKDDETKSWAMPMELLAGDGLEIRKELLKKGLEITTNSKGRYHLLAYIQSSISDKRARCVDRIGWHGASYVLPDSVMSKEASREEVVLQGAGDFRSFSQRGTLEDWSKNVAAPCRGNSRLVFVLAFAFAPPLLAITGDESGGVHLVGPSSIGKTLALRIAGSVWGGGGLNGFLQKWRATINGLEGLAQSRCDTLLVLDEISEIDAKDAGQAVYMLANGTGKRRLNKNSEPEKVSEWRTLFLSSGEVTLKTLLNEQKEMQRGGQAVRLADLDADAGKGMGIFEDLNGFSSAQTLVDHLRESSQLFYGTPIRRFMEVVTSEKDLVLKIRMERETFLYQLGQTKLSGQLQRVANRFSLVAAAGALACQFGILPFRPSEIHACVKQCFQDWVQSQPSQGNFESSEILSQIRSYLQQYSCSQFPELNDPSVKNFSGKCSGFRRKNENGAVEWLVLNEVFRKEVCRGFDYRLVIKTLRAENLLKANARGPSSSPMRLPHLGMVRVYHLRAGIMEDSVTPVTESILKSVTV